jgi:hypothetical protein
MVNQEYWNRLLFLKYIEISTTRRRETQAGKAGGKVCDLNLTSASA